MKKYTSLSFFYLFPIALSASIIDLDTLQKALDEILIKPTPSYDYLKIPTYPVFYKNRVAAYPLTRSTPRTLSLPVGPTPSPSPFASQDSEDVDDATPTGELPPEVADEDLTPTAAQAMFGTSFELTVIPAALAPYPHLQGLFQTLSSQYPCIAAYFDTSNEELMKILNRVIEIQRAHMDEATLIEIFKKFLSSMHMRLFAQIPASENLQNLLEVYFSAVDTDVFTLINLLRQFVAALEGQDLISGLTAEELELIFLNQLAGQYSSQELQALLRPNYITLAALVIFLSNQTVQEALEFNPHEREVLPQRRERYRYILEQFRICSYTRQLDTDQPGNFFDVLFHLLRTHRPLLMQMRGCQCAIVNNSAFLLHVSNVLAAHSEFFHTFLSILSQPVLLQTLSVFCRLVYRIFDRAAVEPFLTALLSNPLPEINFTSAAAWALQGFGGIQPQQPEVGEEIPACLPALGVPQDAVLQVSMNLYQLIDTYNSHLLTELTEDNVLEKIKEFLISLVKDNRANFKE